jgi:hypothetical protein
MIKTDSCALNQSILLGKTLSGLVFCMNLASSMIKLKQSKSGMVIYSFKTIDKINNIVIIHAVFVSFF